MSTITSYLGLSNSPTFCLRIYDSDRLQFAPFMALSIHLKPEPPPFLLFLVLVFVCIQAVYLFLFLDY